jgi:hypothetical protein
MGKSLMRALTGVITSTKDRTLTIKLESGLTVSIAKRAGFEVGDTIWVGYDYTHNRVAAIYPKNPNLELIQDTTEEVEGVAYEDNSSFINPEDIEALL